MKELSVEEKNKIIQENLAWLNQKTKEKLKELNKLLESNKNQKHL